MNTGWFHLLLLTVALLVLVPLLLAALSFWGVM